MIYIKNIKKIKKIFIKKDNLLIIKFNKKNNKLLIK